jgi:hypothetical protein
MRGTISGLVAFGFVAFVAASGAGCTPQIGDSCTLSTDCSTRGDRLCDTSMPGGYCTIFGCEANQCPGDSVCVEFHPDSPRFARRFCVAPCGKGSDCRGEYACVSPADRDARILDSDPAHGSVCLP